MRCDPSTCAGVVPYSLSPVPGPRSPVHNRHSTRLLLLLHVQRQPVITTASRKPPARSARSELLWQPRSARRDATRLDSPRINRKPAPNVINGLLCGCASLFALASSYCSMSMGLELLPGPGLGQGTGFGSGTGHGHGHGPFIRALLLSTMSADTQRQRLRVRLNEKKRACCHRRNVDFGRGNCVRLYVHIYTCA